MLISLFIKNLLIIDTLEINFKEGFNTLTGETGTGKSILVDCLGFALGTISRRGSFRKNEKKEAEAVVCFHISENSKAHRDLHDAGFCIKQELIIRRSISIDGKKRSFINDKPCSVDFVQKVSDNLIEFQGQNEERSLLNQKNHIKFLDDFGNNSNMLKNIAVIWDKLLGKKGELEELKKKFGDIQDRVLFLEGAISEIEKFNPKLGEEVELIEKRKNIKSRSKLVEHLRNAYALLGSEKFEDALFQASKELMLFDALLPKKVSVAIELVDNMLDALSKVSSELEDRLQQLEADFESTEDINNRFFDLRELAKKYLTSCDGLTDVSRQYNQELEAISSKEANEDHLNKEIFDLEKQFTDLGKQLSISRLKAAKELDKYMMEQMSHLKLANAIFTTELSEKEPNRTGVDQIVFTASTNKGLSFGAIEKVASGGELSRFLLALKVCLVKESTGTVLLFDEIDRGVGGSTADAIGRRLLGLSEFGQVIAVTHSPQVAAHASNHFQVSKELSNSGDVTVQINELCGKNRIDEVARMISGKIVTDEARAAAKSLIYDNDKKI